MSFFEDFRAGEKKLNPSSEALRFEKWRIDVRKVTKINE